MLPKILGAMLMGRAPAERRPRSRPLPAWTPRAGATHPSDGHFAVDEPPAPGSQSVALEAVDAGVAQAMADEARRLSRPAQ